MKPTLGLLRLLMIAIALMAHEAGASDDVKRLPPPEPTVENLMAVSGIKTSLDRLPSDMANILFGNMPESIPEEAKRTLGRSYSDVFPQGSISTAVAAALKSRLDSVQLSALVKLASSPIAMKMTELEHKEPRPEEIQSFAASLAMKPPTAERLRLIKELLDQSQNLDALTSMISATRESISHATSSGCADDRKRIRDEFARNQPAIRQSVYATQMSGLIFIYRNASDDDLRKYIEVYRAPYSKAFQTTLARLVAQEYLARWKVFEKTLHQLGNELSGRSMFAKTCRSLDVPSRTVESATERPKRTSLSGKDARECLKLEDNRKIMACAEKYR